MPVKYVDPKTGEFLPFALEGTGAPSRYGIDTPEKLVTTSLSTSNSGRQVYDDIFFMQNCQNQMIKAVPKLWLGNKNKKNGVKDKKHVNGKAKNGHTNGHATSNGVNKAAPKKVSKSKKI